MAGNLEAPLPPFPHLSRPPTSPTREKKEGGEKEGRRNEKKNTRSPLYYSLPCNPTYGGGKKGNRRHPSQVRRFLAPPDEEKKGKRGGKRSKKKEKKKKKVRLKGIERRGSFLTLVHPFSK